MVKCRQCRNVFHVIGDALNAQLDTTVLLEMAAQSIVEEFNLKACHFRLLSRDLLTLDDVASYGLSEAFLNKGPVDAEKSVAAALKGEVVMVADCVSDPRVQYPEAFKAEGIVSLLTVPLKARGQVIGVMRLFTSSAPGVQRRRDGVLQGRRPVLHQRHHRLDVPHDPRQRDRGDPVVARPPGRARRDRQNGVRGPPHPRLRDPADRRAEIRPRNAGLLRPRRGLRRKNERRVLSAAGQRGAGRQLHGRPRRARRTIGSPMPTSWSARGSRRCSWCRSRPAANRSGS